jgi:hypothetical protein
MPLAQGDQIADGHGQRREHGRHRRPHVGVRLERHDQHEDQPDEACALDTTERYAATGTGAPT